MARRQIVLNIQDNVTDALIKSQNKRIATLESLIKKKAKKSDVGAEMRELKVVKSMMATSNAQFERKSNKLLEALQKTSNRPFLAQIVPHPS